MFDGEGVAVAPLADKEKSFDIHILYSFGLHEFLLFLILLVGLEQDEVIAGWFFEYFRHDNLEGTVAVSRYFGLGLFIFRGGFVEECGDLFKQFHLSNK